MLNRSLLSVVLFYISAALVAQSSSITIKVTGIEEVKGSMSIALYDKAEDFPSNDTFLKGVFIPLESMEFEYIFEGIDYGTYAIAIYHDLDQNQEMNKNWMGVPKEPYGFSNNATGRMGPPDFEDASFAVNGDLTITIKLR